MLLFCLQILSNILSYLSIDDLKNVRFVSKFWDKEGAKQLKKRSWVFLNFGALLFTIDRNIGMTLFRFDNDVKNSSSGFGLSNAVLSLPHYVQNGKMMVGSVARMDFENF